MKVFKSLFVCLGISLLMAACEKAEPLKQYVISINKPVTGNMALSCLYANQVEDSLVFASNCPWRITTHQGDGSWITIKGEMSGKANMICRYGVSITPNKTGSARMTVFRITDSEDPDRAYSSFSYQQYASRIDGSLGSSPLVKSIKGSDGSEINVSYDAQSRPLTLSIKGEQTERTLNLSYIDEERKVTVSEISKFHYKDTTYTVNNVVQEGVYHALSFNGVKNVFYDPYCLSNLTNTNGTMQCHVNGSLSKSAVISHIVEYRPFYMNEVYPVSFENAFKLLDQCGPFYTQYGIYYNGKGSLTIDAAHVADSMAIYHHYSDNHYVYETYTLSFGSVNNCATNLDVNQLLEGVDNCNPYMLLSMFRMARFTSVISEAKGRYNSYQVETTANADGSVKTMTVKDKNGQSITYTLVY